MKNIVGVRFRNAGKVIYFTWNSKYNANNIFNIFK